MKSKIPSNFIVALVALFGCAPANAADDSLDWLTKAAEQGDANAQSTLGEGEMVVWIRQAEHPLAW